MAAGATRPTGPAGRDDAAAAIGEVDLAAVRAVLAEEGAPAFWKSLEALADTPAFRRFVGREYPAAAHLAAGPDRRGFFKVMAASFAMMGLAACDNVEDGREYEVPYVRQPERIEAGATLAYASSTLLDGFANGIAVTTTNGRPIKVEGNDRHPWSRGGTDIFGQASVLGLYDPTRSQTVRYLNRISDWDTFRNQMLGHVASLKAEGGKGFRLLTGPLTSPSTIALIRTVLKGLPQARWHMASGLGAPAAETASTAVFGRRVDTRLHFDKAKVVVAFEGDFLDNGPAQVGLARRYVEARRASATGGGPLLALHAAAATPSLTSAKADYHVAVEADAMLRLVERVAAAATGASPGDGKAPGTDDPRLEAWASRAGKALAAARGASIVTAGATQPAAVIEAVHRLNAALGNIGTTVTFAEPVLPEAETAASLVEAMGRGEVSTLLMLDTNPVYTMPGSADFAAVLQRVPLKIQAGAFLDETGIRVDWHLPLAHPLESWGDARAVDGTASLIQPMIRPLFEGRTAAEILSLLFEPQARGGLAIVKSHWQGSQDAAAFEPKWKQALVDGFWPDTAAKGVDVSANAGTTAPGAPLDVRPDRIAVVFRPDPTIRDGAFAASSWLQELPKPLTKVTWENVVLLSPKLAESLHLRSGDIVAVASGETTVEGAAWIMPGQAERTVTLTLGYGRHAPDAIFDGHGYDANPLRSLDQPWVLAGARLSKTGRRTTLATTQDHNTMEGHDFVRVARVGDAAPVHAASAERSLYGPVTKPEDQKAADYQEARAWGMVIDTDACIGCNSCAVACQSENNIAVVGREQVALGRAMHWLRIDRYYSAAKAAKPGLDDPDTHFQPVPCMHCELAPCEVGCPVEATLHDHEGLNLMVYNRCVGTRACSGYCPYKVRRFNYLEYTSGQSPSVQLRNNPEVTVRARGVMEKCTYCVQRIAEARIAADKSGEPIADGAVQTACQTACPTRAITFGNLADNGSAVATARRDPRNYDLLGELNVRPRTTYLAELAPAAADHAREG